MVELDFDSEIMRASGVHCCYEQKARRVAFFEGVLQMETIRDITKAILGGCVERFLFTMCAQDQQILWTYDYNYEYNDPPSPSPINRIKRSNSLSTTSNANSEQISSSNSLENSSNPTGDNTDWT
jgi:hypothetical protein